MIQNKIKFDSTQLQLVDIYLVIVNENNNIFYTLYSLEEKTNFIKILYKFSTGMLAYYQTYRTFPEALFELSSENVLDFMITSKIFNIKILKFIDILMSKQMMFLVKFFKQRHLKVKKIINYMRIAHNGVRHKKLRRK